MTLTDLIENGDELKALKTLRKKIARAIDYTIDGRDLSSLSQQFYNLTLYISELEEKNDIGESVCDIVRSRYERIIRDSLIEDDFI